MAGDEFLLLMPEISRDEFEKCLKHAKQKTNEADVPGYTSLHLSVSVGGVMLRNRDC